MQDDQRLSREANVDQRLLGAEAEAAGAHQVDVQAALIDGLGEGVHDRLGAVARPASAHADRNARARRQQFGQAGLVDGVEAREVADSGHDSGPPLIESVQFLEQRTFVHMSQDSMVDLNHRRQRALAKAGDRAQAWRGRPGGDRRAFRLAVLVGGRPKLIVAVSSRSREPRVWHAVPRQMLTVLRPCGSRLKSA